MGAQAEDRKMSTVVPYTRSYIYISSMLAACSTMILHSARCLLQKLMRSRWILYNIGTGTVPGIGPFQGPCNYLQEREREKFYIHVPSPAMVQHGIVPGLLKHEISCLPYQLTTLWEKHKACLLVVFKGTLWCSTNAAFDFRVHAHTTLTSTDLVGEPNPTAVSLVGWIH